jgi:hypothetical protein
MRSVSLQSAKRIVDALVADGSRDQSFLTGYSLVKTVRRILGLLRICGHRARKSGGAVVVYVVKL